MPLRDATRWLANYRQFWEESYDRLDELLEALKQQPDATPGTPPRTAAATPITEGSAQ